MQWRVGCIKSIASESIENGDDLDGVSRAPSKMSNFPTAHLWYVDHALIKGAQPGRDHRRRINHECTREQVGEHMLFMVRRSLDVDAAHALVQALIHNRLDYCNDVLAGCPLYMFKRSQSVLNAAARLVLPGRQSVSIPMRNRLNWLRFPQRVVYKLCVLSYKCLHGLAPEYLSRRCVRIIEIPGRANLRPA